MSLVIMLLLCGVSFSLYLEKCDLLELCFVFFMFIELFCIAVYERHIRNAFRQSNRV